MKNRNKNIFHVLFKRKMILMKDQNEQKKSFSNKKKKGKKNIQHII